MNQNECSNDQNDVLDIHDTSMENPSDEKELNALLSQEENARDDVLREQVDSQTALSTPVTMPEEIEKETRVKAQDEKVLEDIPDKKARVEEEAISNALLLAQIQKISQQLDVMQKGFDAKMKYDANKAETIQYQRRELKKYQDDHHFKILRPIIMDLISIHDDMSNLIQYEMQRVEIGDSAQKMIRNLESFQGSIETILEHQGVTSFRSDTDVYNSKLQKIRKIIKSTDLALDGKVAERLSKGFRYEEKTVRPEVVTVYKCAKPDDELENLNELNAKA